jgi:hypothetical protein
MPKQKQKVYNSEIPKGQQVIKVGVPEGLDVEPGDLIHWKSVAWRIGKSAKEMTAIVHEEVATYWCNVQGAKISKHTRTMNVENYKETGAY